jgi:pilus assembly protein CpaB
MNFTRIAILSVAAVAAGAAAFLVRGMLGGGTPPVKAEVPAINLSATEVLVASADIEPGRALSAGSVHWQPWPKSALSPLFITKDAQPDIDRVVERAFVRAPLVSGEPITTTKIVRADSASFMAATLLPGKRAVSIPISAETGAGGFILPNDRVDVILTREVDSTTRLFKSETILGDVRVLAIDQAPKPEKDEKATVGKTATLELGPAEAELIAEAKASGTLSLALRALGDDSQLVARKAPPKHIGGGGSEVTVIRYGRAHSAATIAAASQPAPSNTTPPPRAE